MTRFSLTSLFVLVAVSAVTCWLHFAVYPFGPLLAWFTVAFYAGALARHLHGRWLGVGCGLMFVLGVLSIPYFLIDGHSVSPYRLERIGIGLQAADVESILGSPSSITRRDDGESWEYSGPTWCYVTISFDANRRVDSIEHDH